MRNSASNRLIYISSEEKFFFSINKDINFFLHDSDVIAVCVICTFIATERMSAVAFIFVGQNERISAPFGNHCATVQQSSSRPNTKGVC